MSQPPAAQISSVLPPVEAVLVKSGAENFPVASRILPAATRRHLMAVYGFARLTDDIGDETEGDRLALLNWLEADLERAPRGEATHPVLQRVGETIAELGLPLDPFRDLIQANRQDQTVHRYATFDDLVGYCMLSAAPVGRLVLMVLDLATLDRLALSDKVCIGLQLVEHIQDLREDALSGRVYFPLEDLRRVGCDDRSLQAASASASVRRLVALEIARTQPLLSAGIPLARTLPLRARLAVAGFTAGGMAALDAVERASCDVLAIRCRPQRSRFASRLATVVACSYSAAPAASSPTASGTSW